MWHAEVEGAHPAPGSSVVYGSNVNELRRRVVRWQLEIGGDEGDENGGGDRDEGGDGCDSDVHSGICAACRGVGSGLLADADAWPMVHGVVLGFAGGDVGDKCCEDDEGPADDVKWDRHLDDDL
jgi:hypothetical protein